jgi:hypothetical protein
VVGILGTTLTRPPCFVEQAACCIVSSNHNEHFDAYVLSESSLFVYEDKLVLKTCGTTRLLAAAPTILQLAAGLDMCPRRCKYSRASFLFPEQQVGFGLRKVKMSCLPSVWVLKVKDLGRSCSDGPLWSVTTFEIKLKAVSCPLFHNLLWKCRGTLIV